MNYGQIRRYDISNGIGIRTSLFVTGCKHKCKNCFNEEYQDFKAGNNWDEEAEEKLIKYLEDPNVDGLSLLGGEPMEHPEELKEILQRIKKRVQKPIWIYSGFTYEEILKNKERLALLEETDVLVDGPFIEDKKDLRLKFRGSSNQRIIDVKKSLESGQVVILDI